MDPHNDGNKRAITQITYLVSDEDKDKKLGLSLFKKENEEYNEIKQIDYSPGSTVNFRVTKESYHSVKLIDNDCKRMSIQLIIWK